MMICEAEKKAGLLTTPVNNPDENVAKSMTIQWELVSSVVGGSTPLRRPKKTKPLDIPAEEFAAWEAASDEAWRSIDG